MAAVVRLNNTHLPVDTDGQLLVTGEVDVLWHDDTYYLYMNNWGGCPGVDCCSSAAGCASCCFNPPSKRYPDGCVYATNHTVMVSNTQW